MKSPFRVIAGFAVGVVFGVFLHYILYRIALPKFEVADRVKNQWHDGPETDSLLANALEVTVNDAGQHGGCIPSVQEANSAAMKILFWQVNLTTGKRRRLTSFSMTLRHEGYVGFKT